MMASLRRLPMNLSKLLAPPKSPTLLFRQIENSSLAGGRNFLMENLISGITV
jgi:hypothetical protein